MVCIIPLVPSYPLSLRLRCSDVGQERQTLFVNSTKGYIIQLVALAFLLLQNTFMKSTILIMLKLRY